MSAVVGLGLLLALLILVAGGLIWLDHLSRAPLDPHGEPWEAAQLRARERREALERQRRARLDPKDGRRIGERLSDDVAAQIRRDR